MTIQYKVFNINDQFEFDSIKSLIDNDLSEPYSIWVYRFFLNGWPQFIFLAYDDENSKLPIGCIICKMEMHRNVRMRGYIGMLVVKNEYRNHGIGRKLIETAINKMVSEKCDEIMLETEVENKVAIKLYEHFGFIKMKRMFRYYLNEGDAYKFILPLTEKSCVRSTFLNSLETI